MRILLYTGKGGVGKTSIAAATACKLAKEGKKVLVLSTDQAHSLSDSLCVKLSGEAQIVCENLDALEIDVVKESEIAWGNLQGYLKQILTAKAETGIEAEELLVFPGLEELFSLFKLLELYEKQEYEVVIVDCAPTGETLSLLKFPETFGNFIRTFLPIERKMVKATGSLIEKITKIPMPKDNVFAELETLMEKLERLQLLMLNKEVLSIRLVTTTERVVVKETKRNFTCLHLYDYNVDAVIVNKVYPKEALEGYFHPFVTLQEEGMKELCSSFQSVPMFTLMLQKQELRSIPILTEVSDFYGKQDPVLVLCRQKIFEMEEDEKGLMLKIYLPFAEKTEMELSQKQGELHISIKNEKRYLTLPDRLKGREILSAKFEEGVLCIRFDY